MARKRTGAGRAAVVALAAIVWIVAVLVATGVLGGCAGPSAVGDAPRPATRPAGDAPRAPRTSTSPAPAAPGGPLGISPAWRDARDIRVGLSAGATRYLLSGSRSWTLETQSGKPIASGSAGERIQISRLGVGPIEVFREGEMAPLWSGAPAETLLLAAGSSGMGGWSGRWYRGSLRIHASAGEGLTLVNVLDLESYLRGVLPSEIGNPPADQYAAVKAQAVAARSYTLSYIGRRAELGFDLWATVEDQVYEGTKRENEQSDRALQETRGEILLAGGLPVRALYSSTCGGRTSNVEDVWPWPWTSYLRSVRDAREGIGDAEGAYCDRSATYRWREEWSVADFLVTVRKYGPPEGASVMTLRGDFLDARVRSRSRCGRVAELVIETTSGETVLRGDRIRWSLRRPGTAAAILRSSFLKIGVARDDRGRPERVIVSGAGNGHGIGLCQHGAMGMARAGEGYRAILGHYYKGAGLATR
ncbi:MAG TPA: SpoIID/LytB domain-containing protein [Acidobacteriota bacterium]|nr:SpoIID/LytB domain-containing protein [Acidobacteriota bacterium]